MTEFTAAMADPAVCEDQEKLLELSRAYQQAQDRQSDLYAALERAEEEYKKAEAE